MNNKKFDWSTNIFEYVLCCESKNNQKKEVKRDYITNKDYQSFHNAEQNIKNHKKVSKMNESIKFDKKYMYDGWYKEDCDVDLAEGYYNPSSEPDYYYNKEDYTKLGSKNNEFFLRRLFRQIRKTGVKKIRNTYSYNVAKNTYKNKVKACELTGTPAIHCELHHLNSVNDFPEQAKDEDNMILIDIDIHKDFHESSTRARYHATKEMFWAWWDENKHNYNKIGDV